MVLLTSFKRNIVPYYPPVSALMSIAAESTQGRHEIVTDASELIVEEREQGRIALVTLNRPEKLNALSRSLAGAIVDACRDLAGRRGLRAVVLTGAGERAFCAGADLAERRSLASGERAAHTRMINAAADALAALPVPVIAAIHGYALGGGAELALACDLRVASDDATFGFPEVKIGIFPGAGGLLRLPRLVGPGPARDLLYTGRRIGADTAFRIGLIDRLVPVADALPVARSLADEIAGNAPLAVRSLKAALDRTGGLSPERASEIIARMRDALDGTRDYAEGLAAFAEHRQPDFRGE